MFKYGVISGPYLVNLCTGKYGPEITPYMDTFHAVFKSKNIEENSFSWDRIHRKTPSVESFFSIADPAALL